MITIFLFLLIAKSQSQSYRCLGYDENNQECLECPLGYFISKGHSYDRKVNISGNCSKKLEVDALYKKQIYVRSEECSKGQIPSFCLGTKENPFDNFMSAIKKVHIEDLAGKYFEQEIKIYFLGRTHYIRDIDLFDSYIRIFRGFNATIEIGPLFCEDEFYEGCPYKEQKDVIDLHVKSTNFQIEINNMFYLYNIRIIGNDIVLAGNSTVDCNLEKKLCCSTNDLSLNYGDCGLYGKKLNLKTLFNSKSLNALFVININLETKIPKMMLENIFIENFYSLRNWLSFIKISDISYNIYLKNITFDNSYMIKGIIYQYKIRDDPYYNDVLRNDEIELLYNSHEYNDNITLENIFILKYDYFQVGSDAIQISEKNSLFYLDFENNQNFYFYMDKIMIKSIDFTFSLASNYLLTFIGNNDQKIGTKINEISVEDTQELGLFFLKNCILNFNTYQFRAVKSKILFLFYLDSGNHLELNNGSISDLVSSQFIFSFSKNFMIILNSIIEKFYECYSEFSESSFVVLNCTLFSIKLNMNQYFIYFKNSNFTFENIYFDSSSSLAAKGGYFYFFADKLTIIQIFLKNAICSRLSIYSFFQIESPNLNPIIEINNVEFYEAKGVFKTESKSFMFFLLFCQSASINTLTISNLFVHDSYTISLIRLEMLFNKIIMQNITLLNLNLVPYYFIAVRALKTLITAQIIINNMTLENLNYATYIDMIYFRYANNCVLSNIKIVNQTATEYVISLKRKVTFFLIGDIKYVKINKVSLLNNNKNHLYKLFFTGDTDYLEFSDCEVISKRDGIIKRLQAFSNNNFTSALILNNKIYGTDSIESSLIFDETGVISIVTSGTYTYGTKERHLYIKDNLFVDNHGYKYGTIGVVGVIYVTFINNTFINNSAYHGGSIASYANDFVDVTYLNVFNCSSYLAGGSIYIYRLFQNLTITNSIFYDCYSMIDGGCLFIDRISYLIVENTSIINSEAENSGGSAFILKGFFCIFNNFSIFKSKATYGGMIYIDQVNRGIWQNSFFKNGYSILDGGFGYFYNMYTIILIEDSEFCDLKSERDGAFLISYTLSYFLVNRTKIFYCEVLHGDKGVFFLEGFNDFEFGEESGDFFIENTEFIENAAQFGANIYFTSNNYLDLRNVTSKNNFGNLFTIGSDKQSKIFFNLIKISRNNLKFLHMNDVADQRYSSMFIILDSDIIFINISINYNCDKKDLFEIYRSTIYVGQSSFYENIKSKFSEEMSQTIFNLIKSKIELFNNTFFYLYVTQQQFIIFNIIESSFSSNNDFYQNYSVLSVSLIFSQNSNLTFLNSYFENLNALTSALLIKNSNLNMDLCIFGVIENLTNVKGNSYILYENHEKKNFNLTISNSLFKNFEIDIINVYKAYFLIIENCTFSRKTVNFTYFSRVLHLDSVYHSLISNCVFQNLRSLLSACIYVVSTEERNHIFEVKILKSKFLSNIAMTAATIYISGFLSIEINSSIFFDNMAITNLFQNDYIINENSGKAGCILIDCEYFPNCSAGFYSAYFLSNKAEKFGSTILLKTIDAAHFTSCIFKNNSDESNYLDLVTGTPLSNRLLHLNFTPEIFFEFLKSSTDLHSVTIQLLSNFLSDHPPVATSGQPFNLSFLLLDFNFQILLPSVLSSDFTCSSSFLIKHNPILLNGLIFFENIKVFHIPNSTIFCLLSFSVPNNLFFQPLNQKDQSSLPPPSFSHSFTIFLRLCKIGEVFLEDSSCFECLPGTFSLYDHTLSNFSKTSRKCTSCPANAFCSGASSLTPSRGYWRANFNSLLFLKCQNEEGCLGYGGSLDYWKNLTSEEKISGKCGEGYSGNLCFYCDQGSAKIDEEGICRKCEDLTGRKIKFALLACFWIFYIAVQVRVYGDTEERDPKLAILIKIMVNHLQMMLIMDLIEFRNIDQFQLFLAARNYFNFLTIDFFVFDCLFWDIGEDMLVNKVIFADVFPFVFSFIMLILWMVNYAYFHFRNLPTFEISFYDYIKERIKSGLVIFISIFYPEILRKCFSLFNCMLIDEKTNLTVLVLSPNIICWESKHKFWVQVVATPGLIFWGILTPLIILIVLIRNKKLVATYITKIESKFYSCKEVEIKKVYKRTIIDIEPQLAEKLFPNGLPHKTEIGCTKQHTSFIKSREFFIKSQEMIMKDFKQFERDRSNKVDSVIKENKIITNIAELYRYIENDDQLFHKIGENDLRDYKVSVRKESEIPTSQARRKISTINFLKDRRILIYNLGFIYRGYKKDYFCWEIIIFARKFLFIFIGTFTEIFPNHIKPTMFVIMSLSFIYFQITANPYQFDYMNNLELISLNMAFFTACIGVLLFSEKIKEISIVFVVIVFIINGIFYAKWIEYIFKHGRLRKDLLHLMGVLKTKASSRKKVIKSKFGRLHKKHEI